MKTIFIHGTVIPLSKQEGIIQDGALAIENDKITYVGATPQNVDTYDQVIDLKGNIIMPGLINTHGHTAMSLLRGYSDDLPLKQWLEEKMWPIEATFQAEHVKWGSSLSMIEMIRTGTTTFLDMYDYMDQVAESTVNSGMRAVLTRGMIGLCSEEVQKQKLEDAYSFTKTWQGEADGRITTMISPHAPYTCPPDFIEKIVAIAREFNLPMHTHMSESKQEVEQNVKDYGVRPPEHLKNLGVFDGQALVAHAVHLTDEEIDLLAEYDVKVSHNPISNLKLASGVARVPALLKKGVTVSLGTDSSSSNNNLNLFEEIKMAALLHKGVNYNPELIDAGEALRMGTIYGAESLFLEKITGSLEVGKQADFIIIDIQKAHLQPLHNPISNLVYATSGYDVKDVYVDGKQILANGELKTIDEEKVIYEINRLTKNFN